MQEERDTHSSSITDHAHRPLPAPWLLFGRGQRHYSDL